MAEHLKQYLDERYPWLEWIVIAYNNINKNESDTNAAYFNLDVSYSNGLGSRGMQLMADFVIEFSFENHVQLYHIF